MECKYHHGQNANSECVACKETICPACIMETNQVYHCKRCYTQRLEMLAAKSKGRISVGAEAAYGTPPPQMTATATMTESPPTSIPQEPSLMEKTEQIYAAEETQTVSQPAEYSPQPPQAEQTINVGIPPVQAESAEQPDKKQLAKQKKEEEKLRKQAEKAAKKQAKEMSKGKLPAEMPMPPPMTEDTVQVQPGTTEEQPFADMKQDYSVDTMQVKPPSTLDDMTVNLPPVPDKPPAPEPRVAKEPPSASGEGGFAVPGMEAYSAPKKEKQEGAAEAPIPPEEGGVPDGFFD